MADQTARQLQYEYKANSNLVLQADVRLIERRSKDEATGEVMSLTGKLIGTRMGDRYQRIKPQQNGEKEVKKVTKKQKTEEITGLTIKTSTILELDEMGDVLYRPKSEATKQTYEVVLSFIQEALGDQPRDVLCGAADEVLAVLKNDRLKDRERKHDTEELLGTLTDERFAVLVNLGKKITDFGAEGGLAGPKAMGGPVAPAPGAGGDDDLLDETHGVNVQFQDTDDEEEEDGYEEEIDDNDDDDEEAADDGGVGITAETLNGAGGAAATKQAEKTLSPHDIGAHWLQRELNKFYNDPIQAQSKANDVLEILKTAKDDRECENRLVLNLGYDRFQFIKLLCRNSQMILHCTLLAQAQSQQASPSFVFL